MLQSSKKLINTGVLSSTKFKTHTPGNLAQCIQNETSVNKTTVNKSDENKYETSHSSEFKGEYRKITRQWNNINCPQLNKIRGKTVESLPCVNVKINNVLTVNSLIDSGASKNFISSDLFNQLQGLKLIKKTEKWDGTIIAANDDKMEVLGEVKIRIKIDNYSWNEKFLVIKQNYYQMILGTPFLYKKGFSLDFANKTCHFKFNPGRKIKLCTDESGKMSSLNQIKIGTPDMQTEVTNLISQYPEVFTDKIGQALDLEVQLQLTDNTPVCIRPYFLSPPAVSKMKKIIDEWLSQDIIEPSTSVYSSPAFLTNRDRLVVNYSELNKKLVKMNYPIGDLQNIYQHLQGSHYFTVIDLNKAFLQCPLSEESRDMTSFSTIFGKYRMKRVCFGLQVGSSVLSSYLDKIFNDIKFKYLINFCDDIVVYSPDKTSHLEHVKDVISRLAKHKLTVNVEKAKFFCTEISFLGHIIRNNTVTIDPERTVNIMKFPEPRTVKQVRQFVGMCAYWLKYIPNFADICRPLHALKKKGAKFKWTKECQSAFETLKAKISNPPILQLADCSKPFVVQTDASDLGCAGILLQCNDDGDLMPIAYYSKKFTDAERKYSIYEKEAFAAIICIERWHEFLEIQPFKLLTDNMALSFILSKKRKFGRISRWIERLLNLPFTVEHRPGAENTVADALSRIWDRVEDNTETNEYPVTTPNQNINEIKINLEKNPDVTQQKSPLTVNTVHSKFKQSKTKGDTHFCGLINEIPMAMDDLKFHQKRDKKCLDVIDSIKKKSNHESYYLHNDVLMHKDSKGKSRIYLPSNLTNMVFAFFHNSLVGGHLGITRTVAKIKEYFYLPELEKIVKAKVNACHICAMSKNAVRKYEGKLISIPIEKSLNTVFIDLLGPLPTSQAGNKYLLVMVDGFSRFLWIHTLRDCTSRQIISKLKQTFASFSNPRIIVSDNASYFVSREFKAYLFKNCIQHRKIAVYKASGNRSERSIRDISTMLRCFYHDKQTKWDVDLHEIQMSLNTARNESTGYTAFDLMFNHPPNNALSNIWNIHDLLSPNLTRDEKSRNLQNAISNIKRSVLKNRKRDRYSTTRRRHPFTLYSKVFIRTHYKSDKAKKFNKKLAFKYYGPYRILYFVTDVTVIVQNINNVYDVKKIHLIDLKLAK